MTPLYLSWLLLIGILIIAWIVRSHPRFLSMLLLVALILGFVTGGISLVLINAWLSPLFP